jgi:catechol 2,3-dioxygenase-like lactoylglutathione lyase family enzyme
MTSETLHFRVENITPILSVEDMSRSLAFYVDILGFTNADWGDDNFTCVSRDKRSLYLCKGGQGSPGTWIWIGFDGDIFSLQQSLQSIGVTIKLPPTNYSWALEMHIEDPDGHVLRFGTEPNNELPFIDK